MHTVTWITYPPNSINCGSIARFDLWRLPAYSAGRGLPDYRQCAEPTKDHA
jgi:hypothetical protein